MMVTNHVAARIGFNHGVDVATTGFTTRVIVVPLVVQRVLVAFDDRRRRQPCSGRRWRWTCSVRLQDWARPVSEAA